MVSAGRHVIFYSFCFAFIFVSNIVAQTWTAPTRSSGTLAQRVPNALPALPVRPSTTSINQISPRTKGVASVGDIQPLAIPSGASQAFQGYFRLPAEGHQTTFLPITGTSPIAYYRDFFFGAQTEIDNAQDGDTFFAQFTVGTNSPLIFSTISFFASFESQTNCFVDSGHQFAPICGGNSLTLLWFTSGQCQDGTWTFDFFTDGADTPVTPPLTVQSQLPPDQIAAISGPAYNQLRYPDDDYDTDCYTILVDANGNVQLDQHGHPKKSAPYTCDGRSGEHKFSIVQKGCLLTNNAMVATYHGYKVTPDLLNIFYDDTLQSGYERVGDIDPNGLAAFAKTVPDPATAHGLGYIGPATITIDNNSVKNAVCRFGPQTLGVDHFPIVPPTTIFPIQHWVTAVGWNNDEGSIMIVDPNGGAQTTLADASGSYNNQFFKVHGYQGPAFDFILPGGMYIMLHSPAELLLTDPNGLREGVDPITSSTYDEIPSAQYFSFVQTDEDPDAAVPDLAPEEKEMDVFQPAQGQYILTVTGTGPGTYDMPLRLWDQNLTTNSAELDQVPTYPGLVNIYTFTYSNPFPNSTPGTIALSGQLSGNGANADVNQFLTFASPVTLGSLVPAGENNFPLVIFYGPTTNPTSFSASLNGVDVHNLFSPAPGGAQPVNIPLPNGQSSLTLQINGTTSTGQAATDTVTLLFDVGGTPPTSPANLTATPITDTEINLVWTPSTTGGVTYSVFRSTTSGFAPSSKTLIASGLTSTVFSDEALTASTTYFYLVEAVDPFASSAASNQASTTTMTVGSCAGVASSLSANFNGTAIPSDDFIWFNSVGKISGLGSTPVTLFVRRSSITMTINGTLTTVPLPDANITFDPNAIAATTTFNTSLNLWQTILPPSGGNFFLNGTELMLPNGLPGGVQNVTWTATFSSDTPGIGLMWQWSAAAYSSLGATCTSTSSSPDLNDLEVKPIDGNTGSQFQNPDHAGTPEEYKSFLLGGATGNGGSNFTGNKGAARNLTPVVVNSCGTHSQPPSCGVQ